MPLTVIVEHIFMDLEIFDGQEKQVKLYRYGLMSLLANAIKGVNARLHSCGTTLYDQLLKAVLIQDDKRCTRSLVLLDGVTINLIHHTDSITFKPILETLLQHVATLSISSDSQEVVAYARLLYITSTVRKGTRIEGWPTVCGALVSLLKLSAAHDGECLSQIEKATAVILHTCPLDVVLPCSRQLTSIIFRKPLDFHFLALCTAVCDLDPDRFSQLLAPHFSR